MASHPPPLTRKSACLSLDAIPPDKQEIRPSMLHKIIKGNEQRLYAAPPKQHQGIDAGARFGFDPPFPVRKMKQTAPHVPSFHASAVSKNKKCPRRRRGFAVWDLNRIQRGWGESRAPAADWDFKRHVHNKTKQLSCASFHVIFTLVSGHTAKRRRSALQTSSSPRCLYKNARMRIHWGLSSGEAFIT